MRKGGKEKKRRKKRWKKEMEMSGLVCNGMLHCLKPLGVNGRRARRARRDAWVLTASLVPRGRMGWKSAPFCVQARGNKKKRTETNCKCLQAIGYTTRFGNGCSGRDRSDADDSEAYDRGKGPAA